MIKLWCRSGRCLGPGSWPGGMVRSELWLLPSLKIARTIFHPYGRVRVAIGLTILTSDANVTTYR